MVSKFWKDLPYNKKSAVSSKTSESLRKKITPSESIFMKKLLDAGFIHHRFQKSFYDNYTLVVADFWIRKPIKLVIEVDGSYHKTKSQITRDQEKNEFYKRCQHVDAVIRISNQQAIDISIEDLKHLINSMHRGDLYIMYNLSDL